MPLGDDGPERPPDPLDDVRKSLDDVRKSLDDVRELTDSQTLRALTHPVRIALIEALLLGGAMTATEVGERIGESPTTCSFHLRQLAKYGFVEEAGGGKGRSRPWRLTSIGMQFAPRTRPGNRDRGGSPWSACSASVSSPATGPG